LVNETLITKLVPELMQEGNVLRMIYDAYRLPFDSLKCAIGCGAAGSLSNGNSPGGVRGPCY
jgi:hypothetical protein